MKHRNAKLKVLELDPDKAYIVTVPPEFSDQDYAIMQKVFKNRGWPKVIISKVDIEVQEVSSNKLGLGGVQAPAPPAPLSIQDERVDLEDVVKGKSPK